MDGSQPQQISTDDQATDQPAATPDSSTSSITPPPTPDETITNSPNLANSSPPHPDTSTVGEASSPETTSTISPNVGNTPSDDSSQPTVSPPPNDTQPTESVSPPETPPKEDETSSFPPSNPPTPPLLPENHSEPPKAENPPINETPQDTSISAQQKPNQPTEVQPARVESTPQNEPEKPTENMANLEPEPLQSPTTPPISPTNTDIPVKKSGFGEILEAEMPSPPVSPISPQSPISSPDDELQKRVEERLKLEQDVRRQLANQARSDKKKEHLEQILEFAKIKQYISNEDIQKQLHVSQSTATNYLSDLFHQGKLKREGLKSGTKYTL